MTTRSTFAEVSRKLLIIPLFLFFVAGLSGCRKNPEPEIKKLNEQEAAAQAEEIEGEISAELADGLELDLWASESLMGDAIGMDIDDNGRAFITVTNRSTSSEFDIRGHRDWMLEAITWETVEDRKEFLHRELSPERSEENDWVPDRNEDGSHDWRDLAVEKEEVYVIEDSTGDGIADRSQLYIRDFNSEVTDVAGSVLYFNDEVFLAVGPDMWRLKDTDRDGMADEKESISYGYNVHIGFSGHGMSGLTMGPDGRVYWSIGDPGINVVDQEGKRWYYPNRGTILRSNPDGSNFEVFAAGVRNTHEFVFDKYGNLISVDNDGDHAGEHERLVHLINGSDSGWRINWQFGKYVDPKNNEYKVWMDEEYFKPRNEEQSAHILPPVAAYHSGPAGMAYNPGTALGEQWKDHFFVAEFVGSPARSAVHAFTLKPKGASFELEKTEPIMRGLLATGMDIGPDGALYFTDWIEGWGTKGEGRIWKLDTPANKDSDIRRETKELLAEDFGERSADELSSLLRHEDMRVRTKAQFELTNRNAKDILLASVEQTDHQLARIHGIWGIGQMARKQQDMAESLVMFLKDSDPEIRTQAAKMLGDVRYGPAAEAIIPLLKDDYARARMYAAEALGRMEHQPAIQPVVDMLEANNDEDVYLRHAGAVALARIGDADAVTALHEHPSKAVRIAAVVALKRMEDPGVAEFLHDEDEYVVTNAARAINDDAFITEALPDLARMLDQQNFINEPLIRRAINANLYSGTPADAQRLAEFATRERVPEVLRVEALATLSVWPEPSILDRVTGRHRGAIEHDVNDAREAVAPVISGLLQSGSEAVKIAATEVVGNLRYEAAYSELAALLENDASDKVRIAALRALHNGGYELMENAMELALNDPERTVRMAGLELAPESDIPTERTVELLASVLNNNTIDEQQSALEILGKIDSETAHSVLQSHLDQLVSGDLEPEIRLDLIKAVENTASDRLKQQLSEYKESKDSENLVEVYQEAMWGGDADRGSDIFYRHEAAQCTRCHAIGDWGGSVGPNLSDVGNQMTREELLESLVDPGAEIAPGYGMVTVTLQEGQKVQGTVENETDAVLAIHTSEGDEVTVQKSQIMERVNPPSAMPPIGGVLTSSELRDLIEFLSTLKEE